jgi:hypothetical protein
VEHDGTCDLVIRRAYYPGWTARLDEVRPARIIPADGGLQSIRLPGSGITRVSVNYHSTLLWPAGGVSLVAVGVAMGVLAVPLAVRLTHQARDGGANKGDLA